MLNPAWQPSRDQVERLLDISHHFLSDRADAVRSVAPAPKPEPERMQVPVVVISSGRGLPDAPEPNYLLHALNRQLNLPGMLPEQGWQLAACAEGAVPRDSEFALMLVDATLEDTRIAYTMAKRLAERGVRRIGILFRCGDDTAAARRCYRRLAVGTIRFLDLTLLNLGYLPNPGPRFAAALAHAAQIVQSQQRTPAKAVEHS